MQTIGVSEDKTSNKTKLVEKVAPKDGSTYNISMQNTRNLNCFHKENIALKEKVETSSTKKENKEVVEINYLPPCGKPQKSRKLRFSAEGKWNILDEIMLTDGSINMSILAKPFPIIDGFMGRVCVKHDNLT